MKTILLVCLIIGIKILSAQTLIYSGQNFNYTLVENSLDTLIIDHCNFQNITGSGLKFYDVQYVEIKNSHFINISNGAIQGSKCKEIIIRNNILDSITSFAIQLPNTTQGNEKISLRNNKISNVKNAAPETGSAIRVFHADSVFIINNSISYCHWSGIHVGRNSSIQNQQKINYLLIDSNNISFTLADGINANENISNSIVSNNTISNIAYDGIGGRPNNGDHGIYWQAPDALIEGNTIYNVLDGDLCDFGCKGLGISLRTSAQVLRNKVYNCEGQGIGYWNDHPKGKKPLIIANNIVYDNQFNAVYINGGGASSKPDSVKVFNNTLHSQPIQSNWHHSCPLAINEMQGIQEINGNILIYENHTDTNEVFRAISTSVEEFNDNMGSLGDLGFADFLGRNFDLTPKATKVINKIPSNKTYVKNDFYGNERFENHDIGAIELLGTRSMAFNNQALGIIIYPNPASKYISIKTPPKTKHRMMLFSSSGQALNYNTISENQELSIIDVSHLSEGIYFIQLVLDQSSFIERVIIYDKK